MRLDMGPNIVRDSFRILSRIDRHPAGRLVPHALEKCADPRLQRHLLVALSTVSAARGGLLGRKVEEEGEVGRGEPDVRRAAPREGETLRGGKGDAGERVAVAEDRRARGELRLERAHGLPPVRGEEQVHGAVVELGGAAQVRVDHLARAGRAIWELAPRDGHPVCGETSGEQLCLRGLS